MILTSAFYRFVWRVLLAQSFDYSRILRRVKPVSPLYKRCICAMKDIQNEPERNVRYPKVIVVATTLYPSSSGAELVYLERDVIKSVLTGESTIKRVI